MSFSTFFTKYQVSILTLSGAILGEVAISLLSLPKMRPKIFTYNRATTFSACHETEYLLRLVLQDLKLSKPRCA